jgi:hypothetical protein
VRGEWYPSRLKFRFCARFAQMLSLELLRR